VGALFFLEATFVRNQIAQIVRSPGRLALWSLYFGSLVLLGLGRMRAGKFAPPTQVSAIPTHALFTAFGAAFVAMIGGAAVYHAMGSVIAFRSRAEGLLFNNTGLTSSAIVRFLQIRKLIAPLTRFLWTIVLNFMVLTPPHADRSQVLRVFLASILVAAIISTLEIPMFLLGRRGWMPVIAVTGSAVAALGTFFVMAGLLRLTSVNIVPDWLEVADPGRFVGALMGGSPWALATLAAVVALLVALAFLLGGDAMPDLYLATNKMFDRFESARNANRGAQFGAVAHDTARIPAGSMALVWKSWITLRRQRGALLWLAIAASISAFIGAGMALLARMQGDMVEVWQTMATLIAFAALIPVFIVVTVADDLGKPIWWMTAPSLFNRLAALTLSRSWRSAIVVGTAPFVLALFTAPPAAAALIYPTALALWWALNASALAIYAAFPSRIDFRGPLFVFRVVATIFITSPMLGIFIAVVERTSSLTFALLSAIVSAILTGLPAIAFAAWRLRYRGVASSLLERAA
jgi:hypothetical protein